MAWRLRSGGKAAPQLRTHFATASRKWNIREGVSTTQTKYPWRRSRSQLSDVMVQEQLGNIRFWQVGDVRCHAKRRLCGRTGQRWAGELTGLARSRTLHHCRKLSKDLVLSFDRQLSILQTGGQPRHALRGEIVTVVIYPDHRVELPHGEDVLPFEALDPARTVTAPVRASTTPAANHPWRCHPEPP